MENKNISNGWAYAAVGVTIAGCLDFNPVTIMGYLLSIFTIVDAILLKDEKVPNSPSWLWFLIPPVYYYKRQKVLGQSMALFYTILITYLAWIFINLIKMIILQLAIAQALE